MDDTISGGYTLEESIEKLKQLREIWKLEGFELHKLLSNDSKLFEEVDICDRADQSGTDFNNNFSLGVLGL